MAGAGSFTHVHDWTMHNAPAGTGSWFGWANAIISEPTPTAAGIEIRRRKRTRQPVGYPMADSYCRRHLVPVRPGLPATPTIGGWISSAVPALAFLALTKLVLSSPRAASSEETGCAPTASNPNALTQTAATAPAAAMPTGDSTAPPAPPAGNPTPISTAAPAAVIPALKELHPVPTGQLLISARMVAFSHQQGTGAPITSGELATRMNVPPALAESLLDHLGDTLPPVTAVNGTVMNGSRP